jgi:hypothetical protein
MTTNNMTGAQMELGFNGLPPKPKIARREGRIARANWWFAKMHEAVASAMDWEPAGRPPAEQIWMAGANREMKF